MYQNRKTEKHRNHTRTYTRTKEDLHNTSRTIDHVMNITDPSQKPSTYTPTGKTDNLSARGNKLTPQLDKTVTHEPTVAAADEKPNPTDAQQKSNSTDSSTIDRKRLHKNPVTVTDDTPTLEKHKHTTKDNNIKLAMSTHDPPTGSGSS